MSKTVNINGREYKDNGYYGLCLIPTDATKLVKNFAERSAKYMYTNKPGALELWDDMNAAEKKAGDIDAKVPHVACPKCHGVSFEVMAGTNELRGRCASCEHTVILWN